MTVSGREFLRRQVDNLPAHEREAVLEVMNGGPVSPDAEAGARRLWGRAVVMDCGLLELESEAEQDEVRADDRRPSTSGGRSLALMTFENAVHKWRTPQEIADDEGISTDEVMEACRAHLTAEDLRDVERVYKRGFPA